MAAEGRNEDGDRRGRLNANTLRVVASSGRNEEVNMPESRPGLANRIEQLNAFIIEMRNAGGSVRELASGEQDTSELEPDPDEHETDEDTSESESNTDEHETGEDTSESESDPDEHEMGESVQENREELVRDFERQMRQTQEGGFSVESHLESAAEYARPLARLRRVIRGRFSALREAMN